jgi:hypothetical protein
MTKYDEVREQMRQAQVDRMKSREKLIVECEHYRRVIEERKAEAIAAAADIQEKAPAALIEENERLTKKLRYAESVYRNYYTLIGLEPVIEWRWFLGRRPERYVTPTRGTCNRCEGTLNAGDEVQWPGQLLAHRDCNKGLSRSSLPWELPEYEWSKPAPSSEATSAAEGKTNEALRKELRELRTTSSEMLAHSSKDYIRASLAESPESQRSLNEYLSHELRRAQKRAGQRILLGLEPVDRVRWLLRRQPRRYRAPIATTCERCKQRIDGQKIELNGQALVHLGCTQRIRSKRS